MKNSEPATSDTIHIFRAIRIRNDLYGSDTRSVLELAKEFMKPICANEK